MAVGVGWTNICSGNGSLIIENQAGDWNITTSTDYTLPYGKVKDKEGNDVQVDYIPASQGYIYEETPCTDAWQRDPNWLPIPDIDDTDEVFYGLLLVFENDYNLVTWTTNSGATVDVGDGSAPISGTGVQSHLYDYSTLAGNVYQYQPDPSIPARNYKQVIFEVTGTITVLLFTTGTTISSGGSNNFVDINCSLPNRAGNSFRLSSNSASLRKMPICERVRIWNWNGAYLAASTFNGMSGMRVVQIPQSGSDLSTLFANCASLDVGDLTTDATTINAIGRPFTINYQSFRSIGNIVANNTLTTGCQQIFYDNHNLRYVGSVTSTTATTIALHALHCTELQYHGEINIPNCTSISQAFDGCVKLRSLSFTDCSSVTNTSNAVRDCHSLYDLIMTGLTVGINLSDTNLSNYGMSRFANSLGTASGSQTITVTGTPYGALLAASDATALVIESVMTGKGYTIAN